ncbi:hypothetical protein LINGRAHAP2_LOCUS4861 [Linum grandiflorum]
MINSIWWGTKGVGGGGVAWMRWERLCVRKDYGGMGFKDLYGFNLAMLGKAKYFPRGDFLSAVIGSNPNLTWPSIVEAKLAVLQGYQWKVGDGSGIRVWGDPWIRRAGDFHVKSRSPIPDWDLRVSALLMPNGSNWDEDRCARSFSSKKSGGNLGYDGGRGRGRPGGLAL